MDNKQQLEQKLLEYQISLLDMRTRLHQQKTKRANQRNSARLMAMVLIVIGAAVGLYTIFLETDITDPGQIDPDLVGAIILGVSIIAAGIIGGSDDDDEEEEKPLTPDDITSGPERPSGGG